MDLLGHEYGKHIFLHTHPGDTDHYDHTLRVSVLSLKFVFVFFSEKNIQLLIL